MGALLMKKLVILFALFPSVVLAQTFESWRITSGVTAWAKTSDKQTFETSFDGAFLQSNRSRGVNGFGLTWVDDAWQRAGYSNPSVGTDNFSLSVNLDLVEAKGGYTVLRHQPWQFYGGVSLDDPWALAPPLREAATVLRGKNLKRFALSPFAEPGQPGDGDGGLYVNTLKLEACYDVWIPAIREIAPLLTVIVSPPGWGHLHECKYFTKKWTNTIFAHDVYLMPSDPIEKLIANDAAFHKARGEKVLFMEAGIADRSKVGTLEEKNVLDRIKASCALYGVKVFLWQQAGT